MQDFKPDTLCIHAGYTPKNGEPRVAPIVQSTTYVYESSKEMGDLFDLQAEGFFYTRLANPTLDAVEKKIAALEGGVGAMLTSSGQAANLMAVLNICPAGFHVVSSSAIYGGTFNLFYKTMKEMGIETTFVPPTATLEELRAAMDLLAPEQRLILSLRVENDLSYTDIAAVLGVREGTVKSRLARARDQLRKKLSQSGNKAAAASSNPQKGGRGHEL